MEKAFVDKGYCNTICLTSPTEGKLKVLPFVKVRKEGTKNIQSIQVVNTEDQTRVIEIGQDEASSLLTSFYTTAEEFKEHQDDLTVVTRSGINVYDKSQKLQLRFEGTNIRSAINVH